MMDQIDVSSEALTSNVKLDIINSQLSRESMLFNKTYDIDGFFGIFGIEDFERIINCSVKFLIFPALLDNASRKKAQRFFCEDDDTVRSFVKIGVIKVPIGHIDLILVIESLHLLEDRIVKSIAEECASFARELPCAVNPVHFQRCNSEFSLGSHRSTRRALASTFKKNECESYSRTMSTCYMYHFKCKLDMLLSRFGVRGSISIFFKCIGTKSSTFTDNLNDCLINLAQFDEAIKFEELDTNKVWVDHCITTTAQSPSAHVTRTHLM